MHIDRNDCLSDPARPVITAELGAVAGERLGSELESYMTELDTCFKREMREERRYILLMRC